MWFRRRRLAVTSVVASHEDEGAGLLPAAPAVRVERFLAALAFHAAQLEDRIGQLERRASDLADAQLNRPDHNDLLEVKLHTSRVSADLGRLALELRSEVTEIKDEADRAAKSALRAESAAELAQDPEELVELAEELLEMADAVDARRRAS